MSQVQVPASRRLVLFDVENGSRLQHVARMLDHLALGHLARPGSRLVALGNWRVVGTDVAHFLARCGAALVHTAPSPGVPDWSDLRIAVEAGVWLGDSRPGDAIDVVSDDRAFDAIGDVAASLGVTFRRVSLHTLPGRGGAARAWRRPAPEDRRTAPPLSQEASHAP